MTREQRVFAIQGNRPSEIFDGIAVHLDAAVGEEFLEAVPVAGDVGEPGFGRDAGELLPEPVAEGLDQGRAAFLPFGETPLRRTAADIGLDGVEFGCDLRAAAVVDFAKPTPAMRPTVRKPQRRAALAARSGQPVVAGIAVNLEDAVEAGEELFAMFTTAPGRIEVDDAGRIGSAPGPSSRARAHSQPVFVLPRPGSSTGARVSSMNSFEDIFRCQTSRSVTGLRWNAALPT